MKQEKVYLEAAPQPLKDVAILLLETGLRLGEALALTLFEKVNQRMRDDM